jgi:hypothetical protein
MDDCGDSLLVPFVHAKENAHVGSVQQGCLGQPLVKRRMSYSKGRGATPAWGCCAVCGCMSLTLSLQLTAVEVHAVAQSD